jgi:RNA polymerase sigma-70 factor (ECF subfamily)
LVDEQATDWLKRWQGGDQQAAHVLFDRFAEQLIALARSHLSAKMSQRIDPEDVVQSAYRSFFDRARKGSLNFENGGDVWRLLVAMTLHKLRDQVDWQTAAKRSVNAEVSFGSEDSLFGIHPNALSRNPSPVMAAVLADELTGIMQNLEPVQRRMLELRLQGHNLYEIAEATQFTQRTVRRVLDRVKELLKERYAAGYDQ